MRELGEMMSKDDGIRIHKPSWFLDFTRFSLRRMSLLNRILTLQTIHSENFAKIFLFELFGCFHFTSRQSEVRRWSKIENFPEQVFIYEFRDLRSVRKSREHEGETFSQKSMCECQRKAKVFNFSHGCVRKPKKIWQQGTHLTLTRIYLNFIVVIFLDFHDRWKNLHLKL